MKQVEQLPGRGVRVGLSVSVAEDTKEALENMPKEQADDLIQRALWSNICLWLAGAIYSEMAEEGEDSAQDVIELAGKLADAVTRNIDKERRSQDITGRYAKIGLELYKIAQEQRQQKGVRFDE